MSEEKTWRWTPRDDDAEHEQNRQDAYEALYAAQKAVRRVVATACVLAFPKDIDDWNGCEMKLREALSHAEMNR